jgi:predicted GNAT family acetyltransferase
LSPADLPLIHSAPEAIQAELHRLPQRLIEGIVAAAIVSDTIVAIAQTYAQSPHHADIGVFTLDGWRNRGLATATAAIVAQGVRETGRTPTWSTGEDNYASMKVAEKLGFTEVARRTYVIPKIAD